MSNFLLGEYEYSLDSKGRLVIPPKFRDYLGDQFVITRGLDGCLFVFSNPEWSEFEDKIKQLPISDKDARIFSRFLLSGAAVCSLDKQGRFGVPAILREFAHLQKNVVVVGVTTRIEIWDVDKWREYTDIDDETFADRMAELGI